MADALSAQHRHWSGWATALMPRNATSVLECSSGVEPGVGRPLRVRFTFPDLVLLASPQRWASPEVVLQVQREKV